MALNTGKIARLIRTLAAIETGRADQRGTDAPMGPI